MNLAQPMLMLIALLFTVLQAAHAAQANVPDAGEYVRFTFMPATIQDIGPLPAGASPSRKVDLAKTKYVVALDVYLAPNHAGVPVMVLGKFNVRRENHQWLTVPVNHTVAEIMTAEQVNEVFRKSEESNRILGRSLGMTNRPQSFYFPDGYQVLYFDSHTVSTREFLFKVAALSAMDQIESIGNEGHLQALVAFPAEALTSAMSSRFPMQAQLTYTQAEAEPIRSVAYWKLIEGTAEKQTLSAADREMLKSYLDLLGCETRLRQ